MNNINWAFLDLETTGLDPFKDRIIEIAVISGYQNGEKSIFNQLINPEIPLPPTIKRLTGIEEESLKDAPCFQAISESLWNLLQGKVIVAHNASFDRSFLEAAFGKPLPNCFVDTYELAQLLNPNMASYSLRHLSRTLISDGDPNHRALPDTMALEKLFLYLLKETDKLALPLLQEIYSHIQGADNGIVFLLEEILKAKVREYQFSSQICTQPQKEDCVVDMGLNKVIWDEEELLQMFSTQGNIANGFENYQNRPQQLKMVRAVAKAFTQKRHLLVEAGTGVGKSLAYLAPSIYWAAAHKEKVIISTHTIALQEQLLQKDICFLKKNLNISFKAAVLKGRNNYLCLSKWKKAKESTEGMTWQERFLLARISLWLKESQGGDKDTLTLRGYEKELFSQLASASETCLGSECPFIRDCFYQRAKQNALSAEVLIVNHALLLTDLKLGESILPQYQYLIIDEAHHLDEEGNRLFGDTLSLRELQQRLYQFRRQRDFFNKTGLLPYWQQQLKVTFGEDNPSVGQIIKLFQNIDAGITQLLKTLDEISIFVTEEYALETIRVNKDVKQKKWWENLSLLFERVQGGLTDLVQHLQSIYQRLISECGYSESDNALWNLKSTLSQLELDAGIIRDFFSNLPNFENVYWLDTSIKGDFRLNITPLKTGPFFSELLFSQKLSVILTSATLSVDESFTFCIEQLGIPGDLVDTLQISSPFLFDEQVLFLVDTSLPNPAIVKEELYQEAVCKALYKICQETKGGTLVLFTSHKQLRYMYDNLVEPLRQHGLDLFADGVNGSRHILINELKTNPDAIVFGASTFWEGIDVPGQSLTAVIMVKLPFFPPNSPIVEARAEGLKKEGKDGFYHYSLPQAVLKFRQGYGRLIRTMDDCGVIISLDGRLVTKQYGRIFLSSLPNSKYLAGDTGFVVEKIDNWFRELNLK